MIDSFDREYRFLSNFWMSQRQVIFEGLEYPSVEHAYQAAKTLDPVERNKFLVLAEANEAKKKGREILIRGDWEYIKDDVMYCCLQSKFENPDLREKLLATGGRMLLEGNTWHDNYWGNCTCSYCKNKTGVNMLGRLLMKIRQEIRYNNANQGRNPTAVA